MQSIKAYHLFLLLAIPIRTGTCLPCPVGALQGFVGVHVSFTWISSNLISVRKSSTVSLPSIQLSRDPPSLVAKNERDEALKLPFCRGYLYARE